MTSTTLKEDPVKLEVNIAPVSACRICLAWDVKLYDIHESGLGDLVKDITGHTWSAWDGFPQQVCLWCRAGLLRAHMLRARSRTAHALLEFALQQQPLITDSFIRDIDRSLHKLTYNTFSDEATKNCAVYHCVYDETQALDKKIDIFIEDIETEDNLKGFNLDCDVISITSDDIPIKDLANSKLSVQNKAIDKSNAGTGKPLHLINHIDKVTLSYGYPGDRVTLSLGYSIDMVALLNDD